ncbi:MAG: FprA family A-type flavoprotein [Desulfosoma sp.]
MEPRKVTDSVFWVGAVDWDRRLFDSLIPLPDGTSYNAYLVRGSEKTALLDSVDPYMAPKLLAQLDGIRDLDFIISHHAEQDHSGTIPLVLERFPNAKVICTPKAKGMLVDLLHLRENVFVTVEDGKTLSLGDRTLRFLHTPWVHWPETMVTFLEEEGILFSCDFFGSHIASSDLFVVDKGRVLELCKRYFGEIMMPHRSVIAKNLAKLKALNIRMIAPSHGQIHEDAFSILEAYETWISEDPRSLVVLPFVSMHDSTRLMVDRFISSLIARDVSVEPFNLTVVDIGKLAVTLVDAATIVLATPTVLGGPHPLAVYAAFLANALRPKAKFLSVIGSYGWGGMTVKVLSGMLTNLKAEVLDPVLCKGLPTKEDFEALDRLAATIASKHRENGFP